MKTKFAAAALLVWLALAPLAAASAEDAVGLITEIKLNRGGVQIRLPGKNWQKPAPLQSVYAGTQIQTTKDATAVLLYTDGMKSITVDEKNSPFEVKIVPSKAGPGVKEIAAALIGKQKPPNYAALAVRGGNQPPVLLAPRNTKIITSAPIFQWMGMERKPGTVRVYGPDGVIWSAENVSLTQMKYPASAPSLKPGVEYYWTIEKQGVAAAKVRFELLDPAAAKAAEEELASVQKASGISQTTAALLQGGLYAARGLFSDARAVLMEAIKRDPDEPTLHFLLADVYDKTGLKNMAAEEYGESDFLLKQR
jgi:tetratricopeptide (TPR) repeat protein